MNPVLAEIYSTIIPSAPYVLGAYVLVFIVLFVYVFFTVLKLKSAEKKMDALEERVEELLK
jgi:CcmD family protein